MICRCQNEDTEVCRHGGLEVCRNLGLESSRHFCSEGWKIADTNIYEGWKAADKTVLSTMD